MMRIGEVADAAGVTSQTIRFYERKGLLPAPERGLNGYRVYDESVLARLRFVSASQAAGLTLAEVRSIIALREDGAAPCAHVVALLDSKLAEVRARIQHLAMLQTQLEAVHEHAQLLDPAECGADGVCHILATSR